MSERFDITENLEIGPEVQTTPEDSYEAPRNPTEVAVTKIWAMLLDLDRVGIQDNFLLLGGESLLAAQAASRVRDQFGVELSLRSIFVGRVCEIAAEIEAMQARPNS